MSAITTIQSTDLITDSRADINNNFTALNTDKIETSVLDTDTTLAANSDAKVATQKAVKAFVQAQILVDPLEDIPSPVVRTYVNSGSPHTWTKPAGLRHIVVELVGSGGAGGGTSNNGHGATGGGGGGYSRKTIAAADLGATETVTVPAGGTGVSNATGNSGGTTSFGSHCSATGGTGGEGSTGRPGAGGSGSSGDVNLDGSAGTGGSTTSGVASGSGGSSCLGGGGRPPATSGNNTGGAGGSYGGGGSGSYTNSASTATTGGAGAQGVCIVTEYYV